ncbi:HdeD family acid-resistance protein [Synechococcus sp. MIT S9508]|uniref:HdeD family acid-resistance protein n=1 Tax=Synechococcus sp. MIT S9508 TaxID=1801629 RepID=UPI00014191F2|nr:DUF308 domain-containing protein [Synechococcus sp. MIT S9508]KZR88581.1 acid-resistance membrane protein [Synechococcus sp. MIT S9508]|tara:strand:+ start:565 stop:1065 length:501 start_codon:yes stop_codon:yes gene_type:complete
MNSRRIAAVLLVIAAIAAILLPFVSATLLTIGIGGIAFAAGIGQFLRLGEESNSQGKLFRVLSALLYIGGSIFILIDPIDSEVSLTLFAGILLLVEGVMELASGASASGPAGGLSLVDGILTSLIGVLLVLEWPSDSLWALGTLFGVALFTSALKLFSSPAEQPGN